MQGGMPHGASPTAIPFIFLIIMIVSLQLFSEAKKNGEDNPRRFIFSLVTAA
jgi:hypothetical protein